MVIISIVLVLFLLVVWFTRAPKRTGLVNGTPITLTSGDVVLHATLNNSKAANSFLKTFPANITFGKSSVDFCTTAPKLETDRKDGQFGWHNGDISYVGGWLSIFFGGQNRLPFKMMVLGNINKDDISKLKELSGRVTIEFDIAK